MGRPRSGAWLVALALGLAVLAAYPLMSGPWPKALAFVGFQAFALAAVIVCIRLRRAAPRLVWSLVAASQALWLGGHLFWWGAVLHSGASPPAASTANALYLAGDVLIVVALGIVLARRGRGLGVVIDAAAIAAAVLLLAWVFAIVDHLHESTLPAGTVAAQTSFAIVDLLMAVFTLRLLATPGRRPAALLLLAGAVAAAVASDGLWNWVTLTSESTPGMRADLAWLAFPLLIGVAALHPSARETIPRAQRARLGIPWDAVFLQLGALLTMISTFVFTVQRDAHDHGLLAVVAFGMALLGLLLIGRTTLLFAERHALHRELAAKSEESRRLAAIVEYANEAVVGLALDGTVTSWNRAAETLYGYAAEDVVGRPAERFAPDLNLEAALESLTAAGRGYTEVIRRHRDGGELIVAQQLSPIHDEHETIVGLSEVSWDVSHVRRLAAEREALLAQQQEQVERLSELNRLRDDFVASVSHEFRTPLTSILGYLELVLEDASELRTENRESLEVVNRNAERLLRLVNDLLFVAQIESATLPLEHGEVPLESVARECLRSAEPLADAGDVELSLAAAPVPAIDGDRERLVQLLDNLVTNAVKFTPAGGQVEVELRQEGARALISVSDSGVGIPPADLEQLFERFFRASNATRGASTGTGLGLTIAKAIAEAHGGRISVQSTEGVGSTFTVELPLAAAAAAAGQAQVAA